MKKTLLFLIFSLIFISQQLLAQNFITNWDLSKSGTAGNNSITFLATTVATGANYTWQEISPGTATGSGTLTMGVLQTNTITGLPTNATIRLEIEPTNLNAFVINNGIDKLRLTLVTNWGTAAWNTMANAFYGCNNLNITTADLPNLTNVTNLSAMFRECAVINGPSNIGSWNTSAVTNMSYMFYQAILFNQPIGTWNTSAVTNMSYMLAGLSPTSTVFNQDISGWNTAAVTNMQEMFSWASSFNQPIGNWNTAAVTNMQLMFNRAYVFNQPIGNWITSSVTNMIGMFRFAYAFNQPIGNWNTAAVTDMRQMFAIAYAFNQPIGNWNTAAVTNMSNMFTVATAFNQPIGNWNVGNVNTMRFMFNEAAAFNQDLSNWNTAAVTIMVCTFRKAIAFNQDISNWNTAAVIDMGGMFDGATAFNQPIGNWNTALVNNMSEMFQQATTFNQPIGNWVTSAVNNMQTMFKGASAFNQPIDNWNTALVTNMIGMFESALAFNQPIGNWTTNAVTSMNSMFYSATAFNQPISSWNTASVTNMRSMFFLASAFDNPIGSWNTTAVTTMENMFQQATAFNQPIGNWNTAAVTNMSGMFKQAMAFNQPIGNWNTAAVTNMSNMFQQTAAFNQPVATWSTAAVTNMSGMFQQATAFNYPIGTWSLRTAGVTMNDMLSNAALSCSNYSATLTGWNANVNTPNGVTLGAIGRYYSLGGAETARTNLISVKNWTINGDNSSVPLFTQVASICQGDALAALPTTSNNGITGTWLPATMNNLSTTLYTFTPTSTDCSPNAVMTILVLLNTASAPSSPPPIEINVAITPITHTTTLATGIGTATGLPTGVTASWSSNLITISGTPTVSGTFNYIIPLTGGCGMVNATGTITVLSPLPVTFTSFTGKLTNTGNQLNWETVSEQNNSHFELERKGDESNFEKIAKINGSGTTTNKQFYNYLDKTSTFKTSYYRLKQIDFDGKFAYSNVVAIKSNLNAKIITYPNPFKDEINITLDAPYSKSTQITLYDMFGRKLALETIPNGNNVICKPNNLPMGSYVLKIVTDTSVYNKVVIKN